MLTDLLGTTVPRFAAPFFRDITWRGPSHSADGSPRLYLTFDDGPHPEGTPLLLDYLSEADVRVTLFFLGSQAEQFPELVRAAVEAGHRVGSHGWTHRSAWRTPTTETARDFERAEALLEDLTGQHVQNVRPPYGRFTPALRRWCREGGRRLVLWDLMPGDFLTSLPSREKLIDRIAGRIVSKIKPGSIVVLHESARSHKVVLPALDRALPLLRAKGWTAGTL
ncbi:MAG: polysaccharide deacetylase family protein [Bacteroidetes bacterium]|nr:polysaccharide deacetylase family protein [Bacteroidota bacterium]